VHLWIEIVARELAMLAALFALGIGPASFLGRRFDAAARLAIAPVLGLCLATCVFTTLIWFTAARNTYWLLPVLAAASIAVALLRSRTAATGGAEGAHGNWTLLRSLRARDALSMAIVCVVVAAPLSYTLHERNSVGPTGYIISDVDGYTAVADGMEQLSMRQAQHENAESASFVLKYWSGDARSHERFDASPLAANLDLLIGLHATDTQGLFLIVFLMAGALGAFAAVRYFAPKPSWLALLAGVLFAGPLFLQLMVDGSQAAICGLSVLVPLAAVGTEVLRERRLANLVLFALLASGLMALYPLYLPGVALAAVLVVGSIAIVKRARGHLSWQSARTAALVAATVTVLTIVFNLVSFTRDVSVWQETIQAENLAKPPYHLPLSVLPGWLLQTRQFYVLTTPQAFLLGNLGQATAIEVLGEAILPAIFVAVILLGLWRRRRGLILVPIILVFAALAEYASVAHRCSYCVDRNTLPIAPTTIVLLMLGIGVLATGGRRWMRWSAVLIALAAVIAVGEQTRTESQLFAAQAYFLGGDERTIVSELPPHPGPVELEGFGENRELEQAVAELPLMYSLVYERNHGEVSLPSEYSDYGGLAYFGETHPSDPDLNPDYRYVLTRLGGVETNRRVVTRTGPLALEERTGSLDATITSGLALPNIRRDTGGLPSVGTSLHMLLVGGGSTPASILLRFYTIFQETVPPQPGVRARSTLHELTICVQATGTAPVRRATLYLAPAYLPVVKPTEKFASPERPLPTVTLLSMRAVTHCSLGGGP
jgi:hypothetical protein